MSASIQSQVMDKAVAVLSTTAYPAYRTRMSALTKAQLPAFNVVPDKGDAEYLDSSSIDRRFSFTVRHMAMAVDDGPPIDLVVDALYVAGQVALFADPTLGGLVRVIREVSQRWEMEAALYNGVALAVIYEVEFCTSRTDPSVAGI